MSEIKRGRPTIYGVDQPKRRSGYPRMNQANHAKETEGRRSTEGKQGGKKGQSVPMQRMDPNSADVYPDRKNGIVEQVGGAHMEQVPRRYVPGMDVRSMQTGGRPAEQRMDMGADRNREARAMSNTGKQAAPGVRRPVIEPGRDEMRRSDFASGRKLRALWSVFGILAVLLVAAIIYEVVLGNGLKETGNQRMAGQTGTQTTTHTNAQTTAQTNAQADAATSAAAADSVSTTPDAGTTGAENDSSNDAIDDSAEGSADDAVNDIPTIPAEGDGVQADAAK